MNINEELHADMVSKLAKPGEQIMMEMTSDQAHLLHMVLGAAGEIGELVDAIKKFVIYQKELDVENVIEELGDLEFYLQGLRQGLYIERETTIMHNLAKLAKRYPNYEFTNLRAIERADKVGHGG